MDDVNPAPAEPGTAVALLQVAMRALATADWPALRACCHPDVVWHVPGRSPLAGDLVGVDPVVGRFQRMRSATASDQPAELVSVLAGADHAAVVQRNWIQQPDGSRPVFLVVTLVRVRDGLFVELWNLVSDQYAIDELWTRYAPPAL